MEPNESAGPPSGRIAAIDVIRGAVMVLMAIDHVRVYSGLPAGGPTPGIFFTRWITHFCAPAFAFFAGTGAFLHGRKLGSRAALARWLATRGALLVILELTVIRASWTFHLADSDFVLAGVIWMLGWCMVLLACMVWMRPRTIGIVGLVVVFAQPLFGRLPHALPPSVRDAIAPLYEFVYPTGADGAAGMAILYTIVPWIGVMAAGYGFGTVLVRVPESRRRLCLGIGLSATAAYVIVTVVGTLLHPLSDGRMPIVFMALNPPKYPASPLFLLMTLGPTIAAIPLLERARGRAVDALNVFGRVPMFFYLLHIPTIHVAALVVLWLRDGHVHPEWYARAPFTSVPPDERWSLPLLYLVFAVVTVLLYFPCRWFADLKTRRPGGWRSYL